MGAWLDLSERDRSVIDALRAGRSLHYVRGLLGCGPKRVVRAIREAVVAGLDAGQLRLEVRGGRLDLLTICRDGGGRDYVSGCLVGWGLEVARR